MKQITIRIRILKKYLVVMTKEGVYLNCKLTPGAGVFALGRGHISHIMKMHYFFKNLSSLLPVIDQTNYVYSIDDQGRVYQNCEFHDPWGWGSDVRALKDYDAAFLYHRGFSFIL